MRTLRVWLVGLVVSCCAVLASDGAWGASGNGEAAKSPETILADAVAATSDASTARIAGSLVSDGQRITLDIVSDHGTAGGGTLITNGAKFDIVVASPYVYLKADAKTWTKLAGNKAAAQIFAGKWLQTSTDNAQFASFTKLFDLGALTQQITKSPGTVTKGKTTSYHGKQAIPLRSSSGGDAGILYVAATGKPYVLGLVGTGKNNPGELRFGSYDTAKMPAAPTGAIDLDQLEQSAGSTSATS